MIIFMNNIIIREETSEIKYFFSAKLPSYWMWKSRLIRLDAAASITLCPYNLFPSPQMKVTSENCSLFSIVLSSVANDEVLM